MKREAELEECVYDVSTRPGTPRMPATPEAGDRPGADPSSGSRRNQPHPHHAAGPLASNGRGSTFLLF